MPSLPRRWTLVVALGLLVAGTGLVLLGVWGLLAGDGLRIVMPSAGPSPVLATPSPTATEPILPPPPTLTRLPTLVAVDPAPSVPATSAPTAASSTPRLSPAPTQALPTASPTAIWTPTLTAEPHASPAPSSSPLPTQAPSSQTLYTRRQRLGLGGVGAPMTQTLAQQLGLGWYLDWAARPDPFRSSQVEYMPMIRLRDGGTYFPSGDALLAAIDAQPGALWLIGNEPDVKWQDNTPSDLYAQLYHELYHLLKTRDPSCRVAIGGVSQPTPLRLAYLDQVLAAYEAQYGEPMPVDVWNVHNFILREERGSWGVDIPPGLQSNAGILREIADHDNLEIFRAQLVSFRRWMKDRGQQNKPLIVSEYGILMP
ncbi:MAG: glycosyl hydrolase, partial [Anaerolineae bacterium]